MHKIQALGSRAVFQHQENNGRIVAMRSLMGGRAYSVIDLIAMTQRRRQCRLEIDENAHRSQLLCLSFDYWRDAFVYIMGALVADLFSCRYNPPLRIARQTLPSDMRLASRLVWPADLSTDGRAVPRRHGATPTWSAAVSMTQS